LSPENETISNDIAKSVIANLKSGGLLKGTVQSLTPGGVMDVAWIAIELPVLGERQVPVKNEKNLQIGQEVVIECVPNPFKPGRYLFRTVGEPTNPLRCHVAKH
jgi:hypothetical protein